MSKQKLSRCSPNPTKERNKRRRLKQQKKKEEEAEAAEKNDDDDDKKSEVVPPLHPVSQPYVCPRKLGAKWDAEKKSVC
jgi:hypothetical protein